MHSTTSPLPTPDAELIQRARQGDKGAISWLFERYQPGIFRYLFYRIGEQQVAEDLTSEVFVRMLRALPAYRPQEAPFQGWLFQIARNLAVDYFRQSNRLQDLSESLQAPGPMPEMALDHVLSQDELRKALAMLNDEQREVIILRFVLELPIGQVAETIGKSGDAVKGLQRRGLMELRKIMSGQDPQQDAHKAEEE